MQATEHIEGSERVVEALGYWPTFHDEEVVAFAAERGLPVEVGETSARLTVHVRRYETVGQGTAEYAQVLRKSLLVHFLFKKACEFELIDFNHQNVINSLTVSKIEGEDGIQLLVEIESIWGFGGTLKCASVIVESVQVLSIAEA